MRYSDAKLHSALFGMQIAKMVRLATMSFYLLIKKTFFWLRIYEIKVRINKAAVSNET